LILTKKIYCLLDDDTYDWLSYWKWSVTENPSGMKYARRKGFNPTLQKPQFIYLHKIVSGISDNYILKFRDGNPLNLQKANLRTTNLRDEDVVWWGSSKVSKFDGVVWDGYHGLWRAEVKGLVIGYYVAEMDAAMEYNKKALELFGNDAVVNILEIEVFSAI